MKGQEIFILTKMQKRSCLETETYAVTVDLFWEKMFHTIILQPLLYTGCPKKHPTFDLT